MAVIPTYYSSQMKRWKVVETLVFVTSLDLDSMILPVLISRISTKKYTDPDQQCQGSFTYEVRKKIGYSESEHSFSKPLFLKGYCISNFSIIKLSPSPPPPKKTKEKKKKKCKNFACYGKKDVAILCIWTIYSVSVIGKNDIKTGLEIYQTLMFLPFFFYSLLQISWNTQTKH